MWPFFNYKRFVYPEESYTWVRIRILHETDKAILVICGMNKIWIPKSRIGGIRLKASVFEVYIKEGSVG